MSQAKLAKTQIENKHPTDKARFQVSGFRCQKTEVRNQMTNDLRIEEFRDSGIKEKGRSDHTFLYYRFFNS
jgi:hypothetical protein